MSNQKSMVILLKLSLSKILFSLNPFHDKKKDLIDASNINVDQIKRFS
jgi:hypothetical protein